MAERVDDDLVGLVAETLSPGLAPPGIRHLIMAHRVLSALSAAGRLRDTAEVGRCGLVCEPLTPQSPVHEVCALPAGHAGWHRSDGGCEWGERGGHVGTWQPVAEETTDEP